jgi:hypothetical protein
MLYPAHLVWVGLELTSVVIGTDCIGSYKIQLPYDHDLDDSFKILSSINKNLYLVPITTIPVSSTIKTDCHDITEILLNVALNTITLTPIFWQENIPVNDKMLNKIEM